MSVRISWESKYQAWECAAKDDSRPVLTNVWIDALGYAVAADGFTMSITPVSIEMTDEETMFNGVLIPRQFFKAATQGKRQIPPFVEVEGVENEAKLWSWDKDTNRIGTLVGLGTFPDWKALLPRLSEETQRVRTTEDTVLVGIDHKLITQVTKAIGMGKETTLVMIQRGCEEPVYMVGSDGAFGVIMPMFMKLEDEREELSALVNSIINGKSDESD